MANVYAVKSGNWSDTTVWNTGALPTAADDVRPNNFVVTIDTSSAVLSLRNNASSPAVAGGRFDINSDITISADTIQGNAVEVIRYIGSTGCSINGNIIRALLTNFTSSVILSGSGVVNISGSLNGQNVVNLYCVGVGSNQTINFTGSATTTTADDRARIFNITSPCTLNITGSMNTTGANQIVCNSNLVTINIDGTLTNTGATSIIATPGNGSIINITGSITGPAISSANIITTLISGSVKSSASSSVSLTGNSILRIIGPISSSTTANGVSSTGASATNIFTGPFYNTGSWNAVYANNIQIINNVTSSWTIDLSNGTQKTLVTANQLAGYPTTNNVRQGIPYGPGNEFTGSLAIPNPSTVKTGVATDNTTGSAILTAQDLFDIATQTLTTSGSIGTLLTGASTVQTVGATIASFKV
jgi:hypothetical protein